MINFPANCELVVFAVVDSWNHVHVYNLVITNIIRSDNMYTSGLINVSNTVMSQTHAQMSIPLTYQEDHHLEC